MIRNAKLEDAAAIAAIYNYYIEKTIVTFDEDLVTKEAMEHKIKTVCAKFPFIVFEENNEILGYAYGGDWKPRTAYKFTVESSIYLNPKITHKGIGSLLYTELLKRLYEINIHVVIGGISLPNEASIALHEKFGFKKVAEFKEVGYKFNKWIDVGYWVLRNEL
ncbi:N-acetyltransferase [Lutibacter sp. HS1-25]|uniref:GNAT family N-acetyltransferase n=1 Tax=Lutibacter sp. HS1-25 TaxID=2485000 RepID=UPI0010123DBF|nr:GNAT family N-acetyltransferase [Lutibacter sp. HS1-25]RXP53228.1 N-acetyltransferase [Lutibacter sp. HS1-25]